MPLTASARLYPGFRLSRILRNNWLCLATAISIACFFARFDLPALNVHLNSDDLMNAYYYWDSGGWRLAAANAEFWSTFNRPAGGVYYFTLFSAFGLNPFPYNVVRVGLLAINTWLFYLLAVRICRSRRVAALASLPIAYHTGMTELAYHGGFIYDVLCGSFYFAALAYYLRRRELQGRLDKIQTAIFLLLYICALNAKEMAVSLPFVIAAYEFLAATQRGADLSGISRRALPHAGPVIAMAIITVIFLYGKTHGQDALTNLEVYRPVFTWTRFAESNRRFMNTIFYADLFTMSRILWVWGISLYIAVRNCDRRLMLLWVWVVVSPLPIAFLPGRGGGCLYIVTAGWAMLAAILCGWLARRIADEPLFKYLRLRRDIIVTAVLFAAALLYVHETMRHDRGIEAAYMHFNDDRWSIVQQFRNANMHPRHGSRIVFLSDPFPNGYETLFIAGLTWKDRTLRMWLQNRSPLSESDIAGMDYVFDFPGGLLTCIKRP
jgi:hypothetical protein